MTRISSPGLPGRNWSRASPGRPRASHLGHPDLAGAARARRGLLKKQSQGPTAHGIGVTPRIFLETQAEFNGFLYVFGEKSFNVTRCTCNLLLIQGFPYLVQQHLDGAFP